MNNSTHTVILGGGFTGLFTALHLSHQGYPHKVILIDKEERFCFKPLLYEYVSGEMEANQVVPTFGEVLAGSSVDFIQETVESIDLQQKQVKLANGDCYTYNNLVLALGSVTGYFGVEGAKEYALPLRTPEDAIAIEHHLHEILQQARQTTDTEQRQSLLTFVIVGAGPSGVEMAGTLADLLPHWYRELRGNPHEVRVVLLNHGKQILEGDINVRLQQAATQALLKRNVPIDFIMGAEATAIRPSVLEYKRHDQTEILSTSTVIWTTGTNTHPLVKNLPIAPEKRDKHGRLIVNANMQLADFTEVFAGGDCACTQDNSLPPTAQVAYQQGKAIAHNLQAMALGNKLKPAQVNLRGTLLKLGIEESAANIFDRYEVTGKIGHLIRQGTYLEMLPTPIHNLKVTEEWLKEEIFQQYL